MITMQCQDELCGAKIRFEVVVPPLADVYTEPPYTCPLCANECRVLEDE